MSALQNRRKNKPKPPKMKKNLGFFTQAGSTLDEVVDVAARAINHAGALGRFLNVELKLFDVVQTAVTVNNTGTNYFVSDIAQGSAYNQRLGNSIKLVKTILRFRFRVNNSASATSLRFIVVRDNAGLATNATLTSVLETVASAAAALLSPYEHSFPERYTPVIDESVKLVIGDGSAVTWFESEVTLPDSQAHILYQNGTGGVANSAEGQWYVLAISDEATNTPTMDFYIRHVFVDN